MLHTESARQATAFKLTEFNISAPHSMQQALGDSSDVLCEIFRNDVNLAVWQRPTNPELLRYTSQLPEDLLIKRMLPLDEIPSTLQRLLPDGEGRDALAADIHDAAQMLGCVMDTDTIGVRLAVLQQAQCPKWHTDAVMLRLLITYQGEGTQYLQGGLGSNACQVLPQQIALLKGSAWSEKSMAIVHRSPPGLARRVVLTLDPL